MKSLRIPLCEELDKLPIEQIASRLEEVGKRVSVEKVNWEDYPYRPLTVVTTAHSGTTLYLDFFVRCNYLRAMNYVDNSPVSEDSCVEFFVEPQPNGHYWNFEMNCIGTVNASHRSERNNPTRLNPDQLATIRRFASCGNRPFQEVEGSFTWNVVIAIPLELIGVNYAGVPVSMRGNFYKCASGTSQPHYLTWNPVETPAPDFHRPDCFGQITLE